MTIIMIRTRLYVSINRFYFPSYLIVTSSDSNARMELTLILPKEKKNVMIIHK